MKIRWLIILACVVSLILAVNSSAQEKELEELLDLDLEELMNLEVISASRIEQKAAFAPANILVITKEQIQNRGYQNLTEVLQDLPGFDFTTYLHGGEYPTNYILRGITDVGQTRALIMVDGIIRNDISNDWSRHMGYNFLLIDVERIEVISGPGSALYGANAYAGIIHVITQKSGEANGNKLSLNITGGQDNTIVPEFFSQIKISENTNIQLAGRLYMTNGDYGLKTSDPGNYFHNNFEPDSVLTTEYGNIANERNSDGSRKKIKDGYNTEVNDLFLRGRFRHNGYTIGFSYWDKKEGLGNYVPSYEYFTNTPGIDYKVHHSGITVFSSYETEISDRISSKSLLYYRNTSILPETGFHYTFAFQSVNNGIDPPVEDKKKSYHGEGFATRFEQQFNIKVNSKNDLVIGGHLEQKNVQYYGISLGPEQNKNSTIVGSTFPSENETVQPMYFFNNSALFAQNQFFVKENTFITAGLRYDHDSEYGNVFNPRVSITGLFRNRLYYKLLYGRAYKAPSVYELHDEWQGNQELKPQRIKSFEIELSYFLSQNVRVKANYFNSRLSDLIINAPNPDPVAVPIGPNGELLSYYQNLGKSTVDGIVLSGDYMIANNTNFSANYILTRGNNGGEMDNIARHKMNINFNYLFRNKVNINLRANYRGRSKARITNLYYYPKTQSTINEVGYDYVTEENPDGYMDGIFLMNAAITVKDIFGEKSGCEAQLIIRNLFNTGYSGIGSQPGPGQRPIDSLQPLIQNPEGFTPAYHPQPGRQILLKLSYDFNIK
ncbi:TonB-dependent receptor plug domain-containing protein [candidate division KSB1 bacterium]